MGNRKGAILDGVAALVLLAAPGCVSKKMFRGSLEDTDNRVVAVESAIEANERRIADLKKETDEKLAAVEAQAQEAKQLSNQAIGKAEEAAKGKLLWTVTLTDDNVKFDFGKALLSADAITTLEDLVAKVKGYGKALYLELEGHTDNVGNDQRNFELGEMRAMAVKSFLNEQGGIPLHAINTVTYGESRPIADNSSSDGRAQNRRVVIRVLE